MKHRITKQLLCLWGLCLFLVPLTANSQSALDKAIQHIQQTKAEHKLTSADLADYVVTDQYTSKNNGVTHIYLRQRFQGIEVVGANLNINIDRDGNVINMGSRFIPNLRGAIRNNTAALSAPQAANAAARHLKLAVKKPLQIKERRKPTEKIAAAAKAVVLTDGGISLSPIPAKLVYQPMEDGTVRLAWEVEIYNLDAQHYWSMSVDAASGKVLKQQDLVIHDNWNPPVVTDDPELDARANYSSPKAASARKTAQRKVNKLLYTQMVAPETATISSAAALATSGTYRVYDVPFETPSHGDRTLVTGKENETASPMGWHNDGVLTYTITKGNNVHAYEDKAGANAGLSPDGGLNLVFDFPLDLTKEPDTYIQAATTNLFYWNNLMHDVFYQFGFDEVSGNFQQTNFTGQGAGLDGVMAEAQDGGGTNNANFLTLQDGVPGRMQMYLWTSSLPAKLLHITAPSTVAGSYTAVQAAYGPEINETGVTGKIVLADPANGCNAAPELPAGSVPLPFNNQAAITGNIALVYRGDCSFISKALNAQASGATGVIVINNIDGDPLSMGGDETGAAVLIPAIMISKADGEKLVAALSGGLAGSLRREGGVPPLKDGDLDNGIIAHEYGHGISTRLTGGPSTQCLSGAEQGGEGWSDFFGLYMTMKAGDTGPQRRGIGTYVQSQPTDGGGIRPAPYSTDMAVNSYTYGDVSNPEISVPHGVGFIWATMLWDMTWNLIEQYGYDPDIYNGKGGNNIALQLVIDGLKLQPCSPGFIDARDAILAADRINNGGTNQCYIWAAFAKRGLGYSAQQGSNDDLTDGVEAFDMPPSCAPKFAINLSANPSPVTDGQELTYNITVTNNTAGAVNGVTVTSTVPASTAFVSEGNKDVKVSGNSVTFKSVKMAQGETITRNFKVKVNKGDGTTVYFQDDMENGTTKWKTSSTLLLNNWKLSTKNPYSGKNSWFAADPDNYSDQYLTLSAPVTIGENALMRFWHSYATEEGFDGGIVEISTNNGLTWTNLGSKMIQNGYNSAIPLENAATISGPAFTGNSNGYVQTIVDLASYKGQKALIRFKMASDVLTAATGWYVDNVDIVSNPVTIANTASVTSRFGGDATANVETLVLKAGTLSQTLISNAVAKPTKTILFPNPTQGKLNLQLAESLTGTIAIQVVDVYGKEVMETQVQADKARKGMVLDVQKLTPGIYLFKVTAGTYSETHRIMITK
ncbi:T9SS-dependent M36 family metallopeptidase [Pontibacter sp. BT310]|uniref:T9SS-dependent M36 family metallopeptidase n=1 Tax=Pontibacter populi TaxID=890055 RepID=A0ABS6XA29_9BACT|nr:MULTISPECIES: T9SS-dependent M36 family metallopeptidase [Pontibacter]MBJ6117999.1 T9SS-dependent M36 family metallopeptidase [Pontibacter sp. BT310]MBR0570426.1 T9SS-dependent M36 family metallopeptidase [Microvirga sp. STS03]MBW3364852.1 T9SS-dependent M36 family metallopeptidase [Pontibacter populi]